jgi:hypothetical protein
VDDLDWKIFWSRLEETTGLVRYTFQLSCVLGTSQDDMCEVVDKIGWKACLRVMSRNRVDYFRFKIKQRGMYTISIR